LNANAEAANGCSIPQGSLWFGKVFDEITECSYSGICGPSVLGNFKVCTIFPAVPSYVEGDHFPAKALYERPGLKLEVAGRVEESADGSALRRAAVERQVKAEKLKAAGAKTADGALLDSVTLEPGEYEKYLGPAYRAAAFERPRTESGALQELPAAEMERLLLGNAPVSEADLRSLAQARAQAVREWLVGTGELSPERASIIAPKMNAEGIKDSGKPTRVDFALK